MTIRAFEDRKPVVAPNAYVDTTALVIGDVTIGEHASLWPMVVARGDVNCIRIGGGTNVQDGCVLHVTHDGRFTPGGYPLTIGENITVGHRAILHACTVGDGCLIGMAATVMDGAVLGPKLILGAGSLVPPGKQLEGGHLWVGSPAKKIRALTDQEFEMLTYSAEHYVELKNRHLGNR